MAKRKTDEAPVTEDADLMAVVEATDPKATEPEVAAPEQSSAPIAPAAVETPRGGGSGAGAFFGMALGGLIAAGAGFGLARYMPDLLPMGQAVPDQAIVAQAEEIAALREQLAALAGKPQAGAALEERIAALEAAPAADIGAVEARLVMLEQAVAELEARPPAVDVAAPELAAEVQALKEQIAELGSGGTIPADVTAAADAVEARLKEAEARAATLAEEAEVAAISARQEAAVGRIAAALDSGAPYAATLRDLPADAVPAVLVDHAATGLPTLSMLRDTFPAVARDALEAALRANMGESWTDRVSNFLRSQTGLRSLTPREGDDPDAILSRAEAALGQGQLGDTLAELDKLPETAKPALADWIATAQRRLEAEAAFATLAAN